MADQKKSSPTIENHVEAPDGNSTQQVGGAEQPAEADNVLLGGGLPQTIESTVHNSGNSSSGKQSQQVVSDGRGQDSGADSTINRSTSPGEQPRNPVLKFMDETDEDDWMQDEVMEAIMGKMMAHAKGREFLKKKLLSRSDISNSLLAFLSESIENVQNLGGPDCPFRHLPLNTNNRLGIRPGRIIWAWILELAGSSEIDENDSNYFWTPYGAGIFKRYMMLVLFEKGKYYHVNPITSKGGRGWNAAVQAREDHFHNELFREGSHYVQLGSRQPYFVIARNGSSLAEGSMLSTKEIRILKNGPMQTCNLQFAWESLARHRKELLDRKFLEEDVNQCLGPIPKKFRAAYCKLPVPRPGEKVVSTNNGPEIETVQTRRNHNRKIQTQTPAHSLANTSHPHSGIKKSTSGIQNNRDDRRPRDFAQFQTRPRGEHSDIPRDQRSHYDAYQSTHRSIDRIARARAANSDNEPQLSDRPDETQRKRENAMAKLDALWR